MPNQGGRATALVHGVRPLESIRDPPHAHDPLRAPGGGVPAPFSCRKWGGRRYPAGYAGPSRTAYPWRRRGCTARSLIHSVSLSGVHRSPFGIWRDCPSCPADKRVPRIPPGYMASAGEQRVLQHGSNIFEPLIIKDIGFMWLQSRRGSPGKVPPSVFVVACANAAGSSRKRSKAPPRTVATSNREHSQAKTWGCERGDYTAATTRGQRGYPGHRKNPKKRWRVRDASR